MQRELETAVAVWGDRHFPAAGIGDACRALLASGVVDGALFPDQLSNFVPAQLWTPPNAPMAGLIPDVDSHSDALLMAGYGAAAAPGLHIHVSTDAVRRPPAETVQAMLTLANMTQGRATFQVGGGEIKQTKPYGHPTNQGMSRMNDLFQIYRRFMDSDGPIDYHGRRWTLTNAHLGAARTHAPQLFSLGAGPMLTDYATSYADGMILAARASVATPEAMAARISEIRAEVANKGRDPDAFRIGIWAAVMLHEDGSYLERAFDNPIIKYMTGTLGRIEPRLWRDEGLPLPVPEDWTYYKHLLPHGMDSTQVNDIVDAVSREHVERAWFNGPPETVAKQIMPFLQSGADWVMPLDYLAMVGDASEAQESFRRTIEVCGALKHLFGCTYNGSEDS